MRSKPPADIQEEKRGNVDPGKFFSPKKRQDKEPNEYDTNLLLGLLDKMAMELDILQKKLVIYRIR
jgi:hypothetical protein